MLNYLNSQSQLKQITRPGPQIDLKDPMPVRSATEIARRTESLPLLARIEGALGFLDREHGIANPDERLACVVYHLDPGRYPTRKTLIAHRDEIKAKQARLDETRRRCEADKRAAERIHEQTPIPTPVAPKVAESPALAAAVDHSHRQDSLKAARAAEPAPVHIVRDGNRYLVEFEVTTAADARAVATEIGMAIGARIIELSAAPEPALEPAE
jgi:hypothetical protein